MFWGDIWKISEFFIWQIAIFGGKIYTVFESAYFRDAQFYYIKVGFKGVKII